jgi:hypothetical protein
MIKSWALLGFDADDKRDAFPRTHAKPSSRPAAKEEKIPRDRKEKSGSRGPKKARASREAPRKKR